MIELTPPVRRATADDAPALADFINMAGEGLPLHVWEQMAKDGEDPWMLGRRRMAERAEAGKVFVIDDAGGAQPKLSIIPKSTNRVENFMIPPLLAQIFYTAYSQARSSVAFGSFPAGEYTLPERPLLAESRDK